MFNARRTLEVMESLKMAPSGAFAAGPGNYSDIWLRDHLYMAFAYYYLGEPEKCVDGVRVVLNILHTQRHKLGQILKPSIHAKYRHNGNWFEEITESWGHHQGDVIGLLLYIVAYLDDRELSVVRDHGDRDLLQLLIFYVLNRKYWAEPDNGIWETCWTRKSSSIGAIVSGLAYAKRRRLASVQDQLISLGHNELDRILPYESRDMCGEDNGRHNREMGHDCDIAQLSLIWPFGVVSLEMGNTILSRIVDGHTTQNGIRHKLVHTHGIFRFWGDEYLSQYGGVSAEWQWDFWLAIIYAKKNDLTKAFYWFDRGVKRITPDGYIAEAYVNGVPNEHTPLGWMHALALIAWTKILDRLGVSKDKLFTISYEIVRDRIHKSHPTSQ